MALLEVISDIFTAPPIPYDPSKHSLKAWAMYCLRDRGFKVIYAQNADFAIEQRNRDKVYFRVSDRSQSAAPNCYSLVWDRATQQMTIIPPENDPVAAETA